MAEYLDKNELIDNMTAEIAEYILSEEKQDELVISIANCIKSYIAMQKGITEVQPVKQGKWCPPLMGQGKCDTYCSQCWGTIMRNSTGIFEETPFCPHCGADMRDATKG